MNDVNIWQGCVGWGNTRLSYGETVDLREFFRAEEDERLGRWRWPEDPDYLVYPESISPVVVRVVRESTGVQQAISRAKAGHQRTAMQQAARAYFDAHPEPKPWREAREGEVWVITVPEGTYPAIFQADAFRDAGGPWDVRDITDARRIWPEPSDG